MKIFSRIIYAICAAFGLLLVYSLTDSQIRSEYLQTEGEQALARFDYDYFVSVRYYNPEPLVDVELTKGENEFHIFAYEVAYISIVDSEYVVQDGIFFLMHQTKGSAFAEYSEVILETDSDLNVELLGFQVLDLPLFSAMDQESTSPLFKKSAFLKEENYQNVTNILINLDNEDAYLETPVSIDWSQFFVKEELENYLSAFDKAPDQPFNGVALANVVTVDTSGPVIRNVAIYVAAVLVLTIVLLFVKKRRMGRMEPTPGLKNDLIRQKESQETIKDGRG